MKPIAYTAVTALVLGLLLAFVPSATAASEQSDVRQGLPGRRLPGGSR